MPSWLRKIGQDPIREVLYEMAKQMERLQVISSGCCDTSSTTTIPG